MSIPQIMRQIVAETGQTQGWNYSDYHKLWKNLMGATITNPTSRYVDLYRQAQRGALTGMRAKLKGLHQ